MGMIPGAVGAEGLGMIPGAVGAAAATLTGAAAAGWSAAAGTTTARHRGHFTGLPADASLPRAPWHFGQVSTEDMIVPLVSGLPDLASPTRWEAAS